MDTETPYTDAPTNATPPQLDGYETVFDQRVVLTPADVVPTSAAHGTDR